MDELQALIESRGAYLIVDADGRARLSKIQPKVEGEAILALHLGGKVREFAKRTAGANEFTVMQLAQMAGRHYAEVLKWNEIGIIGVSHVHGREKFFSARTAFCAGIFGALARCGQNRNVLRAVAELLGVAAQEEAAT